MRKNIRVTEVKLQKLQDKYPAALYSYFRVVNTKSALEKFVKNPKKPPVFVHHEKLSMQNVQKNLGLLIDDLKKTRYFTPEANFLNWRLAEYHILEQFCRLKTKKQITEHDKRAYLSAQYDLYGNLDASLFVNIFAYLRDKAIEQKKVKTFQKIKEEINIEPSRNSLSAPTNAVFVQYKNIFCQTNPELCQVLDSIPERKKYESAEIKEYFAEALRAIGAEKHGWRVIRVRTGNNIVVSRFKKKILLPYTFSPKSALRLRQVIVHEVGGHVFRSLSKEERDYNGFDDAEEGLAILLEQLVDDHFVHKRAMRYFAICLATGVDGKERDFIDVYQILLKAYIIIGYGPKSAQKAAFNETTRAFRGGLPAEPGVVYIKDKIYLEGNLKVWAALQKKQLTANEFRQLFGEHDNMQEGA